MVQEIIRTASVEPGVSKNFSAKKFFNRRNIDPHKRQWNRNKKECTFLNDAGSAVGTRTFSAVT